jgi:hypothetical protein
VAPLPGVRNLEVPGGSLRMLDNGEVGLGLLQGPGSLRLVSIYDLARGIEMSAPGGSDLFAIEATAPDQDAVRLTAADEWGRLDISETEHDGLARGLEVTYASREATPWLSARLSFAWDGPRVEMDLDVTNDSDAYTLDGVEFPLLALGTLGDDPDDDTLIYPQGCGAEIEGPLVRGGSFDGAYPSGWSSMQFMALYGPAGGLYIGMHDRIGCPKNVRFVARPETGETSFSFWHPVPDATVPGNDFTAPGLGVIETFRGDWYDAARIYRAWVEREAEWWPRDGERRLNPSGEAREIVAWAQANGTREDVVGPVKAFAEAVGVPSAVHWYSWHEIPFDVQYPHYFPTKPGFAEGVRELQDAGILVMPYINGRLWDSACDDFEAVGKPGAAKNREGEPYIEEYGSGAKLAPMCPATKVWRDKVKEIVLRLMSDEYGVQGVYIDQVAAAAPALCFDKSHGHALGGGPHWTRDGYWPLLTAIREAMPPGRFLTTECNGEPYTHLFDEYLTWHWQYPGQIPVFPAVYGGQVEMFGRSYSGDDLAVRMKAAQQLVFGEQIGWLDPRRIEAEGVRQFFIDVCRMRHALGDYLVGGTMVRPPTLVGDIPEVTSDWKWGGSLIVSTSALLRGAWRADDGRVVAIVANCSDEPVRATFEFDGADAGFDARGLTVAERTLDGLGEARRVAVRFSQDIRVPAQGVVAYEIAAR